jgi:hypothetical protein
MNNQGTFSIEWRDSGKEPECAPDPRYPTGCIVDLSEDCLPKCYVRLPYPAQRIGAYIVQCQVCGMRVAMTTAGRADDPKAVLIACHQKKERVQ